MKKSAPSQLPLDRTQSQLTRRDLLRYGLSFAAVSALSNTTVSAITQLAPNITPTQPASKPNIVFLLMDNLG